MSSMNTGTIDVNYPIPGVNNNSQGFRDNFNYIKSNLDIAASELTDLQNKVLLKAPLNGQSLNNDLNNNLISNALTLGFRNTTYNLGNNLSGQVTIDVTNGDVQYGTISGNVSIAFTKWAPVGTHAQLRLILLIPTANISNTITLPAQVDDSKLTLENYNNGTISAAKGVTYIELIFSTEDCGTNITVVPVNRPRKTTQIISTVPASAIGAPGDKPGAISTDSNYLYVCTANYDGTTNIWKRVALSNW